MAPTDPNPQAGFALLSELADSEIAWLRANGEVLNCEPGTLLVREGTRIETLYVVLSGVLSITIGGAEGREIAKLGPGQIIGEMSFLEDRPASASVRSLEGSEVLALPRAVMEEKLRQDPAFSSHLYRGLAIVASRRLRDVVGKLERWLGEQPVAEEKTLARWSEIARQTQEFKARIVAAGKSPAGTDGSDMVISLRAFAAAMDGAIGPTSPETIDAREELGARIQRELLSYFLKASTPARIYDKPRGYPADFRVIEMIYANQPAGQAPVGHLVDEAFLSLPSIVARRSGRALLQEQLRRTVDDAAQKPVRITSVGSAPGAELRGLAAARPADVEATFVEFDEEALASMRAHHVGARVRLEQESLVNLALSSRKIDLQGQDFAYSMLLSSFSDRFAIGLLNYLHGLLRPGGWAWVGGLHPSNPDKTFLAHILGWSIAHRDEDAIKSLFERSAFGRACENIVTEEQGIFYLAGCQKT